VLTNTKWKDNINTNLKKLKSIVRNTSLKILVIRHVKTFLAFMESQISHHHVYKSPILIQLNRIHIFTVIYLSP